MRQILSLLLAYIYSSWVGGPPYRFYMCRMSFTRGCLMRQMRLFIVCQGCDKYCIDNRGGIIRTISSRFIRYCCTNCYKDLGFNFNP